MTAPLLSVRDLHKAYPVTRGLLRRTVGQVRAVDGVSFDVGHGETVALVGESGCGKTTVGRALVRLVEPTSGTATYRPDPAGMPVALFDVAGRELRRLRGELQIVFQDPYGSLNPRMGCGEAVAEVLRVHRLARGVAVGQRVAELFELVGLPRELAARYPHELSGGQRQRLGIARALAVEPRLVVCDEAVSALDVSIQAQVLNLLADLQQRLGLSYLFIAHDLSVVRHFADRVLVMYLGRIVEAGPTSAVFEDPRHPYTRALLAAVPRLDPGAGRRRERSLAGEVPSALRPPSGCAFHPRCPLARPECARERPALLATADPTHTAACPVTARAGDG